MNTQNNKNLIIATALSVIIMISWTWFYEKPRLEKISLQQELEKQREISKKDVVNSTAKSSAETTIDSDKPQLSSTLNNEKKIAHSDNLADNNYSNESESGLTVLKTRQEIIDNSQNDRVKISNEALHGSINLRGARFDDLTLARYFKNPPANNPQEEVILFSPSDSKERYVADFGFVSSQTNLTTPNKDTLWQADNKILTPQNPVTLTWLSPQNIEFKIKITVDDNYLFTIQQKIKNLSADKISIAPYGRINRALTDAKKAVYILHEGPIGAFNKVLSEATYEDLAEEKMVKFTDNGNNGSWLGITDKYWLSSLIPDKKIAFEGNFSFTQKNQNNLYNTDFVGQEFVIDANEEVNLEHHLFAGAKKVKTLDNYGKQLDLRLFDRAIDFGWFYFLTKPFFFAIEFLYKIFGNFGLAILGMTVLVKLALFPMANKSYSAIAKLKTIQPKIEALREKYKDDKMALNREMMEFYKREKINPASGCLPIIIQIPVFFALYKVFYVTLDMRHAPFYGWIKDLSAPDPTTILNLFGLLPFEVSSSFSLGIWPVLMGATMVIQQKLSPPPADPTQAKILKFMPYGLTLVLATFPAGLVIYWTWSNILSILQQLYINKKYKK